MSIGDAERPTVRALASRDSARAGDLFQLFRDGVPHTRAELVDATGLARSTVVARLAALRSVGLIRAAGEAGSSGGRPPAQWAFDRSTWSVLAIDVGASHLEVAVTDLGGDILLSRHFDSDVADGPAVVLAAATAAGTELLRELGRSVDELVGVGIGLPGPVDHSTGRPVKPPIMPGWDGYDVSGFVRRTLMLPAARPVLVDNDVNIMALGERSAAWPDVDHLLFVKVATGIGAGMISDGRLHRGRNGTAGDLGHVPTEGADDIRCRCGHLGCLEAVASGAAIASALSSSGVPANSAAQVVELAESENLPARQALRSAGRRVGSALATYVNLFNPAVIVLGGSIADAAEFIAGVRERVFVESQSLAASELSVVRSEQGHRAAVSGAARLVIDEVLAPTGVESVLAGQAPVPVGSR